jgi:hypothetical protein
MTDALQYLQSVKAKIISLCQDWDSWDVDQKVKMMKVMGIINSPKVCIDCCDKAGRVVEKRTGRKYDIQNALFVDLVEVLDLAEKYLKNKTFL